MTATTAPVQVLVKATRLLEQLANEGELSVARLAELTSEPKTTVHRLLSSLQSLGLVERDETRGTFRVGLKLLELGSSVLARFDERHAAFPALRRLHDETEQTVYLCVREGHRAICIDRIDGRWVRSMVLQVGGSLPLHVGAAPRVLLAFAGPDVWQEYLAQADLRAMVSGASRDPQELVRRLEEICVRGYEVSDGDTAVGMAGVSAPVFDFSRRIRASISMSGPSEALLGASQGASIDAVVATAAEISLSLGYRHSAAADVDTSRHLEWLRPAPASRPAT
jgi:DNA-binding IclR family transcriptional regulator